MFEIALNVDEVAELLRVSRHTVYRLAQRGDLPGRKIGRIWRFSRSGVEQYLFGNSLPSKADPTDAAPVDPDESQKTYPNFLAPIGPRNTR